MSERKKFKLALRIASGLNMVESFAKASQMSLQFPNLTHEQLFQLDDYLSCINEHQGILFKLPDTPTFQNISFIEVVDQLQKNGQAQMDLAEILSYTIAKCQTSRVREVA